MDLSVNIVEPIHTLLSSVLVVDCNAVSTVRLCSIIFDENMIMYSGSESIRKAVTMSYCKVVSWHLPRMAKRNHEKCQVAQIQTRFFQIRSCLIKHAPYLQIFTKTRDTYTYLILLYK